MEYEEELAHRIERSRVPPNQDSYHFTELSPTADYEVGVIAYVDHEPRQVYRFMFTTADKPTATLDIRPVIVKEGDSRYTVHWKKPEGLAIERFVVEYKPNNDTKWLRLPEDREVTDDDSYQVTGPELADAFSVRIVAIGKDGSAVALTKEALVSGGAGDCEGPRGVPKSVRVDSSRSSLTFSWQEPDCRASVLGYEYSVCLHRGMGRML